MATRVDDTKYNFYILTIQQGNPLQSVQNAVLIVVVIGGNERICNILYLNLWIRL